MLDSILESYWLFPLVLFASVLLLYSYLTAIPKYSFAGKHVAITGGSSGIGLSVAVAAIQRGAHVTLIARNRDKLEMAREQVLDHTINDEQRVAVCSLNVKDDLQIVRGSIQEAEDYIGKCVDVLVNCAGTSVCGCFEDIPPSQFEDMMNLNFMGSVIPTQCVVANMKRQKSGRIVFCSSQAGQIGIFGYTAYSASKYALRGFSEALQMELRPHNIYLHVAYPPDTDTPGYKEEMAVGKPKETITISETSGLFSPDRVAEDIICGVENGKYSISTGVEGWLLSQTCAGTEPVHAMMHGLLQALIAPLGRIIILFNHRQFAKICKDNA
ncbi:hypothetical protein ACHWQZ_G006675 [Mnemiopsis leidyi]